MVDPVRTALGQRARHPRQLNDAAEAFCFGVLLAVLPPLPGGPSITPHPGVIMSEVRSVIIPAAGSGERWNHHLGIPKRRIPVDGETLLTRTERLARKRCAGRGGVRVIAIVPCIPEEPPGSVEVDEPLELFGCDLDKITCGAPYWSKRGRTVIIWGDVWLSEAGASRMFGEDSGSLAWWGRLGSSRLTGKCYGEIWGLAFEPSEHARLIAVTASLAARLERGENFRPLAWMVYAATAGPDAMLNGRPQATPSWRELDDWTEDFDYPYDFGRWQQMRASWKNPRP